MADVVATNMALLGSIRQNQVFNRINALHYQKKPLLVCLQHDGHKHCLYIKAHPEPVSCEVLTATWDITTPLPANYSAYNIVKVIMPSGLDTYEFAPFDISFNAKTVTFTIPEVALEAGLRDQQRFFCEEKNIPVNVVQNAIVYSGRLIDYSTHGILVRLICDEDQTFNWLNHSLPAMLTIMLNNRPIYTGQVSLTKRGNGQYLLVPDLSPTPRYAPKEYRARRQRLVPSPDLIFEHPVLGKKMTLKVANLSSLGFSVEQDRLRASLIPGLLIKNAQISFSSYFSVNCTAQVVYFQSKKDNHDQVKIGFAILNICTADHLNLINLIQQAQDPNAYISNQVDPSALFDFFFESGFIYPKKYAEIANRREEVAQAYNALYEKGVDVSRHFVYQNAGQIIGHFSSLRVYNKTWLSQHHAALKGKQAGMRVVRAISEYINDSYLLNPSNIEYIIGYYQVSNKFPRKYFGNYVETLKDPQKTCLDSYSYINAATQFSGGSTRLEKGWALEAASASDIADFYGFYQSISDGMLPEALDMLVGNYNDQSLSETFSSNGLVRKRTLFALRQGQRTIALLDIQRSDFGLNLSEITNAMTVYSLSSDSNDFNQIRFALYSLAEKHEKLNDPVMFYPHTWLPKVEFPVDKEYTMWTLNVPKGMDSYMTWMNKYCR